MNRKSRIAMLALFVSLMPPAYLAQAGDMVQTGSDIPSKWQKPETGYDYVKRDEMIPMRDGVKLHTIIVVPKGAHDLPMLLERSAADEMSWEAGASAGMPPRRAGSTSYRRLPTDDR